MQRKTAVVYTRLSAIPPNATEPFATQLAECRLAADRLGADVIHEFCEVVIPGQLPFRLLQAIDTAVETRASFFIVPELSRLSRAKVLADQMTAKLQDKGVAFIAGPF